jgi:hypothetical protein
LVPTPRKYSSLIHFQIVTKDKEISIFRSHHILKEIFSMTDIYKQRLISHKHHVPKLSELHDIAQASFIKYKCLVNKALQSHYNEDKLNFECGP